MKTFDVVILGAGGAGMMCAIHAGKRGRSVALIDQSAKPGGKIIISGGGRCNFTNLHASAKNYVSKNEHFCKSAMSRFTPEDFIGMVRSHQIAFHERKHGELFCDSTAQSLIDMLRDESNQVGAQYFLKHKIIKVTKPDEKFLVETDCEEFSAHSVVVATGGLSIPKMGASGIGYSIAKSFGHSVVELAPALDGFVFSKTDAKKLDDLAGIALEVEMSTNGILFRENLLFTHAGLSGPVSLQVSLHWNPGDKVKINFLPQFSAEELYQWFVERKSSKAEIKNLMIDLIPKRLTGKIIEMALSLGIPLGMPLANLSKESLEKFCNLLQNFEFIPESTVGYNKAEVTRGGVNTDEISSKTMESKLVSRLFFIGEVVDVTGWLGGFNYQWAWASGAAAGSEV